VTIRITPAYDFPVVHIPKPRAPARSYGWHRLGHRDAIQVPLTEADERRLQIKPDAPSCAAISAYRYLRRTGKARDFQLSVTREGTTETLMFVRREQVRF
jgi:hypothetical protein